MYKRINVSLDAELIKQIDRERGDAPRSKWIQRIIERSYGRLKTKQ